MSRFAGTIGILLLLLLYVTGLCGEDAALDSILASVNGDGISLSDVMQEGRTEEWKIYATHDTAGARDAIYKLRRQIVEEIVKRKLILAEYAKSPFPIDSKYVESMLDGIAVESGSRTRSEFIQKLRESKIDPDQFRAKLQERIIVQAMVGRFTNHQVYLSPKEVYDYFQSHRAEFDKTETIELAMIFLDRKMENYQDIRKTVEQSLAESANQFQVLARTFSKGPNALEGGVLGEFSAANLRKDFAEALKNVPPGVVKGPLELEEGCYFLLILQRNPAQQAVFREHEAAIRKKLEDQIREKTYEQYVDELKQRALIRYYF